MKQRRVGTMNIRKWCSRGQLLFFSQIVETSRAMGFFFFFLTFSVFLVFIWKKYNVTIFIYLAPIVNN